jgi:hypothetical protein
MGDTFPPPGARTAVALLRPNTGPLSAAVVRQLKRTVPRYREVDSHAMQRNVGAVLKAVEQLLAKGNIETLRSTISELVALRSATGFGVDELITAGFCFLPVLRRFFTEHARDVGAGLDAYEYLESMVLPMFGFVASHAANIEEVTNPGSSAWQAVDFPASIESLEEDEVTQPNQRRPS